MNELSLSDASNIIKQMLEEPDDTKIQESCCLRLADIAKNDSHKIDISKRGGIEVIVLALQLHVGNAKVQKAGCEALNNLSYHSKQNIITIPSDGGIHAIIDAMKEHLCEADLQVQALQALYNLACNDRNKCIILNENGVELIVNVMNNNRDNVYVQTVACRTLRNMCYLDDEIKLITSNKGGVGAIIRAMTDHRLNHKMQEEACKASYDLSCNNLN